MKQFAKIFFYLFKFSTGLSVFILLSISLLSAQPRFIPEFRFEWGPGVNISYFDIGGGSPGISFGTAAHYRWNKNFMIGTLLNYHLSNGTDAGSPNAKRGFDFHSSLIEATFRLSYLISFKPLPEKRWKKTILPYIFAGTGPVAFFPNPEKYPEQDINSDYSDYSHFALMITGGAGLYYRFNNYWSAGLDGCLNLPFSDNLEGFSSQHSIHNDSYYFISLKAVYIILKDHKGPLKPKDFR